MNDRLVTSFSAILFLANVGARAEPAVLAPIVVSASRSDTDAQDMPLHTTIITQDDIRKSPAQSLDQLLRQVPGMNLGGAPFYTTDPTGHQVRMRGVTNSKVLVLLDGVPLHDPFYGTIQWFKVPLSSVERIEVVRGGNSSLWGNLAVAGVINIISKKPTDNATVVDASYGSMNTLRTAIAQNLVISDALRVRVSGDLLRTDGYQTTPAASLASLPGKGDSSAHDANAQLAAYYTPAPDLSAWLRTGYHRQNEDIGGYVYGTNLQKSPDVAAGVSKGMAGRGQVTANVWSQYVGFDKYNGAGCYWQANNTCNTTTPTAQVVQYFAQHDENPYRELGGSALYSKDMAGALSALQLGLDYRRISGSDSQQVYSSPKNTPDVSGAALARTNYGQGSQQFTGVFSQLKAVPADPVELTLSLRYDYWNNTDGVSRLTKYTNGTPGAPTGGDIADTHKGSFNPTLAVRYDASRALDFRGAVYRAFRAPGLNNMYRSFGSTSSITLADPGLKPETLTGGEAGADYRAERMRLGATAYAYTVKDMIATYKIPNAAAAPAAVQDVCGATLANCPASVNFYTNAQDGRAEGLELTGQWDLNAMLKLDASYTNTRSYYTRTSTGDPTHVQLGAVPRNVTTVGLTAAPSDKWTHYADLRYTGPMYLDVNQTLRQGGFTVVDLRSAYHAGKRLDVYASVVNLFDKEYTDNATTSAASETLSMPRTVTVGMQAAF